MLARISGTIEKKFPGKVILSVGPVAFEVLVPFSLYEILPEEGKNCTLFVINRLRGESLELYGFSDWESRDLFLRLQGISRVGPRLALNILSVFKPEELTEIVAQADYGRLAKVPGIGPKRAERLGVELRNLLGLPSQRVSPHPLFGEALSSLLNLGFSHEEAEKALGQVFRDDLDLAELIREALKRLSTS